MYDTLSRRDFVAATTAAATVSAAVSSDTATNQLPMRVLGQTGVRVPLLGYGTAPTGTRRTLDQGVALLNEALDFGVTYLDTAPEFAGYGMAQVQVGHVLKQRRKEAFVVTKTWEPKGDEARRLLEKNLTELQIDHADLVYAHSVGDDKMDPAVVMGKGGVMEFLLKAKEEGLARFIGLSGHCRPWRFLEIISRFEIDVMMTAVNFADRYTYNFEQVVWPVAAKKKIGLVAMKTLGGANVKASGVSHRMMPEVEVELALRYALGLPNLSVAVVGMATREELLQNLAVVKNYQPLAPDELAALDRRGRLLAKEWQEHFGPAA